MYYTKIVVDEETYEVSDEYNIRDLKKCLRYNFASIMNNKFLLDNLNNFNKLINENSRNRYILQYNGLLVGFVLGSFKDNNYKATIFCWNHIYKRFSRKLLRAWSLLVFKRMRDDGIGYFIIPILKHRKNFKNYFKLMQRVFPEGELDSTMDTENVKVLKINLSKIV